MQQSHRRPGRRRPAGGYASWDDLDHWSSAALAARLAARIGEARASERRPAGAQGQAGRAEAACDTLRGEWKETEHRIRSDIERPAEDLAGDLAPGTAAGPPTVDDDARDYLDEASAGLPHARLRRRACAQFSRDLTAELGRRRRNAGQDQQGAADTLKAAIGQYNRQWPNSAPDDTGDVDRSGADYAALHEEITRPPAARGDGRFQRMITQDMVPSVGVLHRTIENESAAIRARMGTVNAGLRRVEFNSGTRLQIAWTPASSPPPASSARP